MPPVSPKQPDSELITAIQRLTAALSLAKQVLSGRMDAGGNRRAALPTPNPRNEHATVPPLKTIALNQKYFFS